MYNKSWPEVEMDHASAVTNYLDNYIGKVIDTLDKLGLANDTVVFFASDNGAQNEGTTHA